MSGQSAQLVAMTCEQWQAILRATYGRDIFDNTLTPEQVAQAIAIQRDQLMQLCPVTIATSPPLSPERHEELRKAIAEAAKREDVIVANPEPVFMGRRIPILKNHNLLDVIGRVTVDGDIVLDADKVGVEPVVVGDTLVGFSIVPRKE